MKEKNERFVEKLTEGKSLSELDSRTVLVDTETGVNYLFIKSGYSGGLTPLYNADGSLVVTK